jgi:L-amino acid N-acyltransferase YncA
LRLQGYVDPAWRGKGIYTHLWNALVDKARELKVKQIGSGTRLDNHRMRAVAKAQGRREVSVNMEFTVPDA